MSTSTSSIRLTTAIPGPKSTEWMKRRDAAVPRGLGTTLPIFVEHTEGATIEDIDGNVFLDFAGGIGCQNMGHRPPEVVAAIHAQADRYLHTCFMVTPYEGYVRLAEMLNERTPGSYAKKTALFNSGAEAVENAIKIARAYTKRAGVIAFEDAFPRTDTADSQPHRQNASLQSWLRSLRSGNLPDALRILLSLRVPPDLSGSARWSAPRAWRTHSCGRLNRAQWLRSFFEPVLGEGGFVVPPAEWFV